VANAYDKPKFTLHFKADAPIDLKCLLYVPSFHTEKFGMGRMEPGVNLYSRKILIENKPKDLLPEWLRFIKGVVDSEDLPLSIAREKSQDSTLLRRIRDVLTRKIIRFLDEQARNNPAAYREFYAEFAYFIKEGVCHDYQFMEPLSKLLLFESSSKTDGELISLDDYISRCTPEQKQIYYLVSPNRETALQSPYYETFKKHGREVLLLYNTIDDFVMSNVRNFAGRELVSAESSAVNLGDAPTDAAADGEDKKKDGDATAASAAKLSDAEAAVLCDWLKNTLGPQRVRDVKTTSRLSDSPAIITDHESGALRRMMKMLVRRSDSLFTFTPGLLTHHRPLSCSFLPFFSTACAEPRQHREQGGGPAPAGAGNQPEPPHDRGAGGGAGRGRRRPGGGRQARRRADAGQLAHRRGPHRRPAGHDCALERDLDRHVEKVNVETTP